MQKLVKEYLDELNKRQKKTRKIGIAVMLLVVLVAGSVIGVLTQYGVAMTGKAKCGFEEHKHTDDCYEMVLTCGLEESEGHTHTDACLPEKVLSCGLEESEGHTHTDVCLPEKELTCGLEESEEHEHTDDCYTVPEGYICGLEESEGHKHTDDCYTLPEGYICGLEETEGHTHTDDCYTKELICELPEHEHTDVCYTDAAADVEDPASWDGQYAGVQWKGIWNEDLVTAAQMQLGYQESTNNFVIAADKSHKGYTRYGHFMGNTYMDWDAAFVNFCIHYAGLDASGYFPMEGDSAAWNEKFTQIRPENAAYFAASGSYTPNAGDLIFLQKEGEETAIQMGIVSSYDAQTATVRAIEGNSGSQVRENMYNIADSHIISYLKISELETVFKGSGEQPIVPPDVSEQDPADVSEKDPSDLTEKDPADTTEKDPEYEARTITVEGPDYTVTVSFTEEAKIPKDAELAVREIERGSKEYLEYYKQSLDALDVNDMAFARCFDITFLDDGKEIEPSAPVDVKITYANGIEADDDKGNVVHFSNDGTEVLDAGIDQQEKSFSFRQDSFSVTMTTAEGTTTSWYRNDITSLDQLDGTSFLIASLDVGPSLMTNQITSENPYASSSQVFVGKTFSANRDDQVVEITDTVTVWYFERIAGTDTFHIREGGKNGKYIYINQANMGFTESENVATSFSVMVSPFVENGKIIIYCGSNPYGGSIMPSWDVSYNPIFKINEPGALTLYQQKTDDIELPFHNVAEGKSFGIDIKDTKIPESETVSIPAIPSEGGAKGDLTKGHSRETGSNQEKAYKFSEVQVRSKSDAITDGKKVDVVVKDSAGKLFFYNGDTKVKECSSEDVENGNVIIQNVYVTCEALHEVATIDTASNGRIKINMIDYPNKQFEGGDGQVRQGILSSYIADGEEYPTFLKDDEIKKDGKSLEGASLKQFFEEGEKSSANYLFLKDTYEKTGYYEYDSTQNGAAFDKNTGEFTVYKELTTISDEKQSGLPDPTTSAREKGNFLPYNEFDMKDKSQTHKNNYDILGKPLVGGRAGEVLYVPKDGAYTNYYFGMELSANFYQMNGGFVDGNAMRYEFTGDDDLWVYVDGVLVLDMGGCHDAADGYIDFSTGEVFVRNNLNNSTVHTTLKDCFDRARENADEATKKKLEKIKWKTVTVNGKECQIFEDYTAHEFKMWYMERGAGASNLKVRFNLPVIPEGEVQIEKGLSNIDHEKYADVEFDFEVYLQNIEKIENELEIYEDDKENLANYSQLKGDPEKLIPGKEGVSGQFANSSKIGQKVKISIEHRDKTVTPITEIPTDGIFKLKPGEKILVSGLQKDRKYYVKEVGVEGKEYGKVSVDKAGTQSQDEDGNWDAIKDKDMSGIEGEWEIATPPASVSGASYVKFTNGVTAENSNALEITKEMAEGSQPSGTDKFTFRVWMKNQKGEFEPFEGDYYQRNKDGKYYRLADGALSDSGFSAIDGNNEDILKLTTSESEPGIFPNISAGDTVVIQSALATTQFWVEEMLDLSAPAAKDYEEETYAIGKKPDGTPTAEEVTGSQLRPVGVIKGVGGSIKFGLDEMAQVTVTNFKGTSGIWEFVKKSKNAYEKLGKAAPGLAGAEFTLVPVEDPAGADSTETLADARKPYYGKSDADGIVQWYNDSKYTGSSIKISDLLTGKYTLTETKAPTGYALSETEWTVDIKPKNKIEVSSSSPIHKETVTVKDEDGKDIAKTSYIYLDDVVYALPKAGGRGIYLYMVGGMLLMMAGAFILYRDKCRTVVRK